MDMPQVLSCNVAGDRAHFSLRIPPGLSYFEGHFTGQPILPGVVQVGWAIALAAETFSIPTVTGGLRKIKFNHVIEPADELELSLALDRAKLRLSYAYSRDGERMSSGDVQLEEAR